MKCCNFCKHPRKHQRFASGIWSAAVCATRFWQTFCIASNKFNTSIGHRPCVATLRVIDKNDLLPCLKLWYLESAQKQIIRCVVLWFSFFQWFVVLWSFRPTGPKSSRGTCVPMPVVQNFETKIYLVPIFFEFHFLQSIRKETVFINYFFGKYAPASWKSAILLAQLCTSHFWWHFFNPSAIGSEPGRNTTRMQTLKWVVIGRKTHLETHTEIPRPGFCSECQNQPTQSKHKTTTLAPAKSF